MLRIGFLPSDFNPMVLMLGEAEDRLGFCTAPRTTLTVTASPGAPGIQALAQNDFVWRLDAERAGAFADQISQLAVPTRAAGSEILECTTAEEIPVKVSRGEYTDDFLR
jgi:hypothetical protein